jgi:hypothetical protein
MRILGVGLGGVRLAILLAMAWGRAATPTSQITSAIRDQFRPEEAQTQRTCHQPQSGGS